MEGFETYLLYNPEGSGSKPTKFKNIREKLCDHVINFVLFFYFNLSFKIYRLKNIIILSFKCIFGAQIMFPRILFELLYTVAKFQEVSIENDQGTGARWNKAESGYI